MVPTTAFEDHTEELLKQVLDFIARSVLSVCAEEETFCHPCFAETGQKRHCGSFYGIAGTGTTVLGNLLSRGFLGCCWWTPDALHTDFQRHKDC